jgi:hypothetical protein
MKFLHCALLLPVLAAPLGAAAGERLYLRVPVQFTPGIHVMPRIKSECALEREMADQAATQIGKHYSKVELAAKGDDVGNDKVIKLTITNVSGVGGGHWSGPKSMTVLAELQQGETILASKSLSRASRTAGLFGGTCDMLHKVTRSIGADVGVWLKRGAGAQPVDAADEPAPDSAE